MALDRPTILSEKVIKDFLENMERDRLQRWENAFAKLKPSPKGMFLQDDGRFGDAFLDEGKVYHLDKEGNLCMSTSLLECESWNANNDRFNFGAFPIMPITGNEKESVIGHGCTIIRKEPFLGQEPALPDKEAIYEGLGIKDYASHIFPVKMSATNHEVVPDHHVTLDVDAKEVTDKMVEEAKRLVEEVANKAVNKLVEKYVGYPPQDGVLQSITKGVHPPVYSPEEAIKSRVTYRGVPPNSVYEHVAEPVFDTESLTASQKVVDAINNKRVFYATKAVQVEPQGCTCSSADIFAHGCKCAGGQRQLLEERVNNLKVTVYENKP